MARATTEQWVAATEQVFTFEHERRALPRIVTEGLDEALMGGAKSEVVDDVIRRLRNHQMRCQSRIERLLCILDNAVALELAALKMALLSTPSARYLAKSGANRALWILATAGSGADKSMANLEAFTAAFGQWLAADQLIGVLDPTDEDLVHGVRFNPWRERTRRSTAIVVHFRWSSELLCTSIAAEVEHNPTKYEGLDFISRKSIRRLFRWVEKCGDVQEGQLKGLSNLVLPPTPQELCALLKAISVKAGAFRHRSVVDLLSTVEIEAFPFVDYAGVVAPVALREASYIVELALFQAARTHLRTEKDRADLFEGTIRRALKKMLPQMDLPLGEVTCPIPGSDNKGETDFIFHDRQSRTFVGECKAMSAVQRSEGVINAFTDQVGKAAKQLALRLGALEQGSALSVCGNMWVAPTDELYGIAVPLHAYGGAVWSYDCLPLVGAYGSCLAVIPAHQLMLVARAMENGQDFASYIQFRHQLFTNRVEIFDELDMLAAYIFLEGKPIDDFLRTDIQVGSRVLRSYGAEVSALVAEQMPTSARAWRRWLRRMLV